MPKSINILVGALGGDGGGVVGEAAVQHRRAVHDGYDAVHRDAAAYVRPAERLQQRLWQRQSRGLDQDMIRPLRHRHQRLDGRDEIVGDGAADAAVGELDDVLDRAIVVGAGLQNVAVNPERAELVDENGEPLAAGIAHQVTDQRCLSRTEKAGDDGDGGFGEISHAVTIGGIRARLCLRKMVGRSRQGTMPSGALA